MPILREKELHDEFGDIASVPFHLPEHLLYALLMLLASLTVLWQNCHPGLTAAVILLTPLFALSAYLPCRFFNRSARLTVGFLVFLAAIVWGRFRITAEAPFDRIAAEMLAIASLTFLAGGRSEYYGRILAVSLFWLVYGALFPRLLYLILFTLSLLLILFLLHLARLRNLAGTGGKVKHQHAWKLTVFLFLIQGVIGGTIFWYVFTLLPTHPNRGKGLFEVSFLTDRDMAMPENFRSWMHGEKRDRKGSEDGTEEQEGAGFAKTISSQGTRVAAVKNIRTTSSVMGAGSAAPPSDELIFRCRMPGKLYHTANLFDRYDGVKWTHSPEFLSLRKFRLLQGDFPQVTIEAKYTVYHLLSRRLFAPFQPVLFIGEDDTSLHTIDRTLGAELSDTLKIPLPLRYRAMILLYSPDKGFRGKAARRILNHLEKINPSSPENPRIVSRRNRFYPAPSHHYPNWGISESDALFHRHIRGRCVTGFELPSPLSVPTVQKPYCCILNPILKDPYFPERRIYASPYQWKRSLLYGRPVPGTVNLLRKKDRSPLSEEFRRDPVPDSECIQDYWVEPLPRSHYLQVPKGKMRPSVRLRQLVRSLTAGKESPYQKALAIRDWLRHNKSYEMFSEPLPKGRETVDRFVFEMDSGHCEYFACAMTLMARLAGLPARLAIGFSPGDYNTLTDQFEVRAYHSHAWSQIFIEGAGWLTFDAVPPGNVISRTRPFGIGRFRDPFGDEWKVEPPELTRNLRKVVAAKVLEMQRQEAQMQGEEEKNSLNDLAEVRDKLTSAIRKQYSSSEFGQGNGDSPSREEENFLSPAHIRSFINGLSFRLMRAYFSGQHWVLQNLPLIISLGMLTAALYITGKILRIYRALRRRIQMVRHHLKRGQSLLEKEPRSSVRESYLAVRHLLLMLGKRRKMREELSNYLISAAGADPVFSRNLQTLCEEFTRAEYSGNPVLPETAQVVLQTAVICVKQVEKDLKIRILSRDFRSAPEEN